MFPIQLPKPQFAGSISIEQALLERRSTRQFSAEALSLLEATQLLWAAQGITSEDGKRTAPSAGGICPLTVYLITGNVDSLVPGVYKYSPESNQLDLITPGDFRVPLAAASFNQSCVSEGAAVIAFSATYELMNAKYGAGSEKFVDMEVGHASQNVHLQAVSLGLGTVVVAAFRENEVREMLNLPSNEKTIYLMPVGKPQGHG
jgi:SagB-type dehydrogenase family enzyme